MIDNDDKQNKMHNHWLVLIHLHMTDTYGYIEKSLARMTIMQHHPCNVFSSIR